MEKNPDSTGQRASGGVIAAFGIGSVSVGVKNVIFGSWLLLYYNQVLGLSPFLAGWALALALLFDAVSDPLVGIWSDRTRTRWGRRHPFMYASLIPFAVFTYLILQPVQDHSQEALFVRLLLLAVGVRLSMTFYEVPRGALGPELSKDYDQRTQVVGISTAFGWLGGAGMSFIALGILFPESEAYSGSRALLNPAGYKSMALIAGCTIFVAGLISTLGLHRRIPYLHMPDRREKLSRKVVLREAAETLSDRSWLVLFLAGIVFALYLGLQSGTDQYYNIYFWQWVPAQIRIFPLVQAFFAISCGFATSVIAQRRDKKKMAVSLFTACVIIGPLPLGLRLLSIWLDQPLFPSNGSELLWWTLLIHSSIMVILSVSGFILIGSMVADIVEESQKKTGRRSEGLLTAGPALAQKTMSAGGVLIIGIVLGIFGFDIPNPTVESMQTPIHKLALTHLILAIIFPVISLYFISKYTITRDGHTKRLQELGYADSTEKRATTTLPPSTGEVT